MSGLESFSSAFYLKKTNNSNTQLQNKSLSLAPPYSFLLFPLLSSLLSFSPP